MVSESPRTGALDHINALSKLYRGYEDYYAKMPERRGKETRVTYKITPMHVNTGG